MSTLKLGDDLPCFKYIVLNIRDNAWATQVSFTISYLKYLEDAGITEPEQILAKFENILFMSQTSKNRKKHLDLLQIRKQKYELTDRESVEGFKGVLYSMMKKPASFSNLYHAVDERMSMCHFCPFNEQYSLTNFDKEMKLFVYMLASENHFKQIAKKFMSLDRIFSSWTDLYKILNGVERPYAFQGFYIIAYSIFHNRDDYYNFIPMGDPEEHKASVLYKTIQEQLGSKKYGISGEKKDIRGDYTKEIYQYLLSIQAEPITDSEASAYIKELLAYSYQPEYYADIEIPVPEPDVLEKLPRIVSATEKVFENEHSDKDTSSDTTAIV